MGWAGNVPPGVGLRRVPGTSVSPSAALRRLLQKGTSKADPDASRGADAILVASALALAIAWEFRGVHADLTSLAWPSRPEGGHGRHG